jgi:magnesium transporter
LPPGTLKAPVDAHPSRLEIMAWGPDSLEEPEHARVEDLARLRAAHSIVWVNVVGLSDVELLEQIGQEFGLHRLALEDAVNIPQRPKVEDYDSHQYLVARMPISSRDLQTEQLSFFFGPGFVVTVQERPGDCFDGIRRRIREGRQRIRGSGSDYLTYAILDSLVDAYLPLIESIAVHLDELEFAVLEHATPGQVTDLHDRKRDLVTLRRYLEPLAEAITVLISEDFEAVDEQTRVSLRDCIDHCRHALDLVESHRAHAGNIMDLHLSVAGQRMNEVMKVLTVIATLFIPLSFIAGLYGMNFDTSSPWNLPELSWRFGYPFALGLMVACAGAMLVYFWRKGWFR